MSGKNSASACHPQRQCAVAVEAQPLLVSHRGDRAHDLAAVLGKAPHLTPLRLRPLASAAPSVRAADALTHRVRRPAQTYILRHERTSSDRIAPRTRRPSWGTSLAALWLTSSPLPGTAFVLRRSFRNALVHRFACATRTIECVPEPAAHSAGPHIEWLCRVAHAARFARSALETSTHQSARAASQAQRPTPRCC